MEWWSWWRVKSELSRWVKLQQGNIIKGSFNIPLVTVSLNACTVTIACMGQLMNALSSKFCWQMLPFLKLSALLGPGFGEDRWHYLLVSPVDTWGETGIVHIIHWIRIEGLVVTKSKYRPNKIDRRVYLFLTEMVDFWHLLCDNVAWACTHQMLCIHPRAALAVGCWVFV